MQSPSAAAPRCRWRARRSSPRQSCQISRAGGLWSRCASGCLRAGSSEPLLPCPAAARDLPLRSLSWSSCVGGALCLKRPCPCRRCPWLPASPSASASRSRSRTRTSARPTASGRDATPAKVERPRGGISSGRRESYGISHQHHPSLRPRQAVCSPTTNSDASSDSAMLVLRLRWKRAASCSAAATPMTLPCTTSHHHLMQGQ